MKKVTTWAAAGLAGVIAAGFMPIPAEAHHSFAMYDQEQSKTLTGRLTRFIPGANHAQLIFELIGADGEPELDSEGKRTIWGVETGPAATIADRGITVKAFPEGTILTVTLNPLRDGRPFGSLARGAVIIKCGAELPQGGCTEKTGEIFLRD